MLLDYKQSAPRTDNHTSTSSLLFTGWMLFLALNLLWYWLVQVVLENTHTHTGPLSRSARVNRYQKGKTNLDFTEARDSEWKWHPLGHMQVCTSLQTGNHASAPSLIALSWKRGC